MKITNNSGVGAFFEVIALYSYVSRVWLVVPDVFTSEVEIVKDYLKPGESKEFKIIYKDGERGIPPQSNSILDFRILAHYNGGIFSVGHKSSLWNRGIFAANNQEQSLDIRDIVDKPIDVYVLPTTVENRYEAIVAVHNPFNESISTKVTQPFPAGTHIISTNGLIESESSVVWQKEIIPYQVIILTSTFEFVTEPGSDIILPVAAIQFDEPSNPNTVVLNSNQPLVVKPIPITARAHTTKNAIGNPTQLQLYVNHQYSKASSEQLTLDLVDSSNQIVFSQNLTLNFNGIGQETVVVNLPVQLTGMYHYNLYYSTNTTKHLLLSNQLYFPIKEGQNTTQLYLPIVTK